MLSTPTHPSSRYQGPRTHLMALPGETSQGPPPRGALYGADSRGGGTLIFKDIATQSEPTEGKTPDVKRTILALRGPLLGA